MLSSKIIPILILAAGAALVIFLFTYRPDLSGSISDMADGETVFREICAQCHGAKGEGRVNLTPPIRGRNLSPERIKALVQKGGQKMPALPFIKGEALENVARYVSEMK